MERVRGKRGGKMKMAWADSLSKYSCHPPLCKMREEESSTSQERIDSCRKENNKRGGKV